MKTYKNLYQKVCDFENLYLAYRKARKGKRGRTGAATFERVQEDELLALQDELQNFTYRPGSYHSFYIHDPKKRLISAAPFRDRVVHHALCRIKVTRHGVFVQAYPPCQVLLIWRLTSRQLPITLSSPPILCVGNICINFSSL